MTKGADRFEFLDGLRGIAALSVAWMHGLAINGAGDMGFGNVGLAVDFFFCLSGFVVAHAYDQRLAQGMTVAGFMEKRLIRLYPMILIGVVLGALAAFYVGDQAPAKILRNTAGALALLPVGLLDNGLTYPLNVPMWSLFFEIAACLAYGVSVKVLPQRWTPWLLGLLGLMLAAAIIAAGQVTNFGLFGVGSFAVGTLRVAYPFLLGVIFHRIDARARVRRFPSWLGVILLVAVLYMPTLGGWEAAYHVLATLAFLPAVLLVGAATQTKYSALWSALGRLSYPLYLVHWPVFIALHHLMGDATPAVPAAMLGLVAASLAAFGILLAYDEPLRAWLSRRRSMKLSMSPQ